MKISIKDTDCHVLNMWTRMPFRYGIAALTALPHVFVRVELETDGCVQQGIAADGIPPKWFTKAPDVPIEDEMTDMLCVIRTACNHAIQVEGASSVFGLWRNIYAAQQAWGKAEGYPPLLWAFGVTLVERAMIDAFCRATATPFARAVRSNTLGIQLGQIHDELCGAQPKDLLPPSPTRRMKVRHTVGLADPLTDHEIPDAERLDDGLPQSLEACVRHYGLTHYKIKMPADPEVAIDRFSRIAEIVANPDRDFALTLDGNEFFDDADAFRRYWQALEKEPAVAEFFEQGLIFVEQPLHRDVALGDGVARAFERWPGRPAIIIDESDTTFDSSRRALACGYTGTSHKNCKGVLKGIANACLIAHRRRTDPTRRYEMSGEDLCNVGPVALLQDLAVAATLGLTHVERNGHHYFAGLSALPPDLQESVLAAHCDLYRTHRHADADFPALKIDGGSIDLGSVLDGPFGYDIALDPTRFVPIDDWRFESLGLDE